jgi:hypothetical protein
MICSQWNNLPILRFHREIFGFFGISIPPKTPSTWTLFGHSEGRTSVRTKIKTPQNAFFMQIEGLLVVRPEGIEPVIQAGT